ECYGNKVAKVTTAGAITEYPLPTSGGFPLANAGACPRYIAAGPDGNLWFGDGANDLVKVTTSGVFTDYALPTGAGTFNGGLGGIAAGPDGNLWFTEINRNGIAKV